ncbi:MAG: hypothetical protein II951_08085 [Bacteroidales bacterium]|nr:hypothetical protein [Bacteroidales bacterium]
MAKKKLKASDVLMKIKEDELRDFVASLIRKRDILALFMTQFSDYFIQEASADAYVSQINNAFSKAVGNPWLNYKQQREINKLCDDSFRVVEKFLSNDQYLQAADILFALLAKSLKTVCHVFESGLDFAVSRCLEYIERISHMDLPEPIRLEIFKRCLLGTKNYEFVADDWRLSLYGFAIDLSRNTSEYETLSTAIEEYKAHDNGVKNGGILVLEYRLLDKCKGHQVAHNLMCLNLDVKEFREIAIQEAMDDDNFEYAYDLAQDGIKSNTYKSNWQLWMLRIARRQGNRKVIVEYASILYLDNYDHSEDFYQILKDTVLPSDWSAFVEGLATSAQKNARYDSRYPDICLHEKWLDRLMEFVINSNSISCLANYEEYLLNDYRDIVVTMHVNYALNLMNESYHERKTYTNIARHLKHILDLGSVGQAVEAAKKLRTDYPRSRALWEELTAVGL